MEDFDIRTMAISRHESDTKLQSHATLALVGRCPAIDSVAASIKYLQAKDRNDSAVNKCIFRLIIYISSFYLLLRRAIFEVGGTTF